MVPMNMQYAYRRLVVMLIPYSWRCIRYDKCPEACVLPHSNTIAAAVSHD
jgi:hypothetical protein